MDKPDFRSLATNPVKLLRETKEMTPTQLATACRVTISVISDLENGVLTRVPDNVVKFFDIQSLNQMYVRWQTEKRFLVRLPPVGLIEISKGIHPFKQYRYSIGVKSVSTFSGYICVPRFVIINYEDNSQRIMPASLKAALLGAWMTAYDIDKLDTLGVTHFELQQDKRIRADKLANDNRE